MTLINTIEQDEILIINNVLKQLEKEIDELHIRFMKVPQNRYHDRWNKIRWTLNEKRTTVKALELLRKINQEKIKEMEK